MQAVPIARWRAEIDKLVALTQAQEAQLCNVLDAYAEQIREAERPADLAPTGSPPQKRQFETFTVPPPDNSEPFCATCYMLRAVTEVGGPLAGFDSSSGVLSFRAPCHKLSGQECFYSVYMRRSKGRVIVSDVKLFPDWSEWKCPRKTLGQEGFDFSKFRKGRAAVRADAPIALVSSGSTDNFLRAILGACPGVCAIFYSKPVPCSASCAKADFPCQRAHGSCIRQASSRGDGRPPAPNRMTCAHVACSIVHVITDDQRDECLKYVHLHSVLAMGTEADADQATPDDTVDLVQVGTRWKVFLLRAKHESPAFWNAMRAALQTKTVLHWGGKHSEKLVRMCAQSLPRTTFVDVQALEGGIGLDAWVVQATRGRYTLCMQWTASGGWDEIPLRQEQEEYAALDVVMVYVAWMARTHDQHWYHQSGANPEFHKFVAPDLTSSPGVGTSCSYVPHGFVCTHEFIGHDVSPIYSDRAEARGFDVRERFKGLVKPMNLRLPPECETDYRGLCVSSEHVVTYHQMLLDKRFCCVACSHGFQAVHREAIRVGADRFQHPLRCARNTQYTNFCMQSLADALGLRLHIPRMRDTAADTFAKMASAIRYDVDRGFIRATTLSSFFVIP
jgi:hypothetical protein